MTMSWCAEVFIQHGMREVEKCVGWSGHSAMQKPAWAPILDLLGFSRTTDGVICRFDKLLGILWI